MNETTAVQALDAPLYVIADEYRDLLDALEAEAEANEGVVPEAMYDRFEHLSGAIAEKIERCGFVVRALQQRETTIADEVRRLQDMRGSVKAAADRLKLYVLRNMQATGTKRSDGQLLNVRVQNNPRSCQVFDSDEVPDEFCDLTFTIRADQVSSDAVKALLAGASDGVSMTRSVRVREIIAHCDARGDDEAVPGARVGQTQSIRIW